MVDCGSDSHAGNATNNGGRCIASTFDDPDARIFEDQGDMIDVHGLDNESMPSAVWA